MDAQGAGNRNAVTPKRCSLESWTPSVSRGPREVKRLFDSPNFGVTRGKCGVYATDCPCTAHMTNSDSDPPKSEFRHKGRRAVALSTGDTLRVMEASRGPRERPTRLSPRGSAVRRTRPGPRAAGRASPPWLSRRGSAATRRRHMTDPHRAAAAIRAGLAQPREAAPGFPSPSPPDEPPRLSAAARRRPSSDGRTRTRADSELEPSLRPQLRFRIRVPPSPEPVALAAARAPLMPTTVFGPTPSPSGPGPDPSPQRPARVGRGPRQAVRAGDSEPGSWRLRGAGVPDSRAARARRAPPGAGETAGRSGRISESRIRRASGRAAPPPPPPFRVLLPPPGRSSPASSME